jgi:hypothetical protein
MINDVTFGGYHKLGSESRMLMGFEEVPDPQAPARQTAAPPSKLQ